MTYHDQILIAKSWSSQGWGGMVLLKHCERSERTLFDISILLSIRVY